MIRDVTIEELLVVYGGSGGIGGMVTPGGNLLVPGAPKPMDGGTTGAGINIPGVDQMPTEPPVSVNPYNPFGDYMLPPPPPPTFPSGDGDGDGGGVGDGGGGY